MGQLRTSAWLLGALLFAGCGGKTGSAITPHDRDAALGSDRSAVATCSALDARAVAFAQAKKSAGTGSGALVADNAYVYWATLNEGIVRVSKATGEKTSLYPNVGATGLALDDEYLYWTIYDNQGTVQRGPKSGGSIQTLATGQPRATSIAVDSDNAYWIATGTFEKYLDGSIRKAPKAGGASVALASNISKLLTLGLGLDSQFVYWTHFTLADAGIVNQATLQRVPKTGGNIQTLFTGGNLAGLYVASNAVYVSAAPDANEPYPTSVWRVPKNGGAATPIANAGVFITQLVEDGGCLYIAGHSQLGRIPMSGGDPHMRKLNSGVWGLVADSQFVYWSDSDTKTLYRMAE